MPYLSKRLDSTKAFALEFYGNLYDVRRTMDGFRFKPKSKYILQRIEPFQESVIGTPVLKEERLCIYGDSIVRTDTILSVVESGSDAVTFTTEDGSLYFLTVFGH